MPDARPRQRRSDAVFRRAYRQERDRASTPGRSGSWASMGSHSRAVLEALQPRHRRLVCRWGSSPTASRARPGGYQATGGMGAVIGRPAPVVGTSPIPAYRPTGPPVITDQPAGSNVVAGPPGVATVERLSRPHRRCPAMSQPSTPGDRRPWGPACHRSNLTPTPARYLATAPAPSVEAAPEAGWGSQVWIG
jgi:hypothetical protein